jgi:hypothetical protein
MLILALFLFGTAIALFGLAVIGTVLMVVLRFLTAFLWVAVKIVEHRQSQVLQNATPAEPEILIVVEEAERPMRDITPTVSKIRAP